MGRLDRGRDGLPDRRARDGSDLRRARVIGRPRAAQRAARGSELVDRCDVRRSPEAASGTTSALGDRAGAAPCAVDGARVGDRRGASVGDVAGRDRWSARALAAGAATARSIGASGVACCARSARRLDTAGRCWRALRGDPLRRGLVWIHPSSARVAPQRGRRRSGARHRSRPARARSTARAESARLRSDLRRAGSRARGLLARCARARHGAGGGRGALS